MSTIERFFTAIHIGLRFGVGVFAIVAVILAAELIGSPPPLNVSINARLFEAIDIDRLAFSDISLQAQRIADRFNRDVLSESDVLSEARQIADNQVIVSISSAPALSRPEAPPDLTGTRVELQPATAEILLIEELSGDEGDLTNRIGSSELGEMSHCDERVILLSELYGPIACFIGSGDLAVMAGGGPVPTYAIELWNQIRDVQEFEDALILLSDSPFTYGVATVTNQGEPVDRARLTHTVLRPYFEGGLPYLDFGPAFLERPLRCPAEELWRLGRSEQCELAFSSSGNFTKTGAFRFEGETGTALQQIGLAAPLLLIALAATIFFSISGFIWPEELRRALGEPGHKKDTTGARGELATQEEEALEDTGPTHE